MNLHDAKCHHCKHHPALIACLTNTPFYGAVPCPQCIHFKDSRTDRFERMSREQIDKQYRAVEAKS